MKKGVDARQSELVTVPASVIDAVYEQGYRDGKEAVLSVLRGVTDAISETDVRKENNNDLTRNRNPRP